MFMTIDRRTFGLGLAGAGLAAATGASAQGAWPTRTVTVIVPFGAGGVTDLFGRLIAQRLQAKLGQPFVVENRAGAGGNVGSLALSRAAPDGYTLGMGTVSSHAINVHVFRERLGYDPVTDFTPMTLVATQPNMLVVHPSVPAQNTAELITWLKANPGQSFASSGVGTSIHLAGEMFKQMAGVEMEHVAYRSSSDVMRDVVAGHIKVTFDNFTSAWPQAQANNVRAIAVSSRERAPQAPNVPAVAETLAGFDATSWHGFFAPPRLPDPIKTKLGEEVRAILREPEIVARIRGAGANPSGNTPDEFVTFMRAEIAKWGPVVTRANIRPE
jgi:tripartite-type tricarboxylate transporter receptor subunit TctC